MLGTDWGNVHVLDSISGNKCKTFQSHEGRVNDISIDKFGDTVASCSDDGKVMIRSLYNETSQVLTFDRPIKAVAIDPEFSKLVGVWELGGGKSVPHVPVFQEPLGG